MTSIFSVLTSILQISKLRSNDEKAKAGLRSEAAGVRGQLPAVLSLCILGAAAACYAASASAETWWMTNDTNGTSLKVHVSAGGSHTLRICATGKTMLTLYHQVTTRKLGPEVRVQIEWSKGGSSSVLFPTPSFKLPLGDKFVRLGADGRYCDQGWTIKSVDFPSAGYFLMYGTFWDFPGHKLFDVGWSVAPTFGHVARPGTGIGRARPVMLGDTRPTFVRPLKHQNFVGRNVTLALTSHVASQFCSAGHYELAWERARVPDQPNGFPGAMQNWLGAPKPNLPCNAAGPAMSMISYASLRSHNRTFHYRYEVKARLVGNGFHGAWSPWREFAVEEPLLRRKPTTGLKLKPGAPSMSTQSGQSSGKSTKRMAAPLHQLQLRR